MGFYTFPISAIWKKNKILKMLIPQSKIILNELFGLELLIICICILYNYCIYLKNYLYCIAEVKIFSENF